METHRRYNERKFSELRRSEWKDIEAGKGFEVQHKDKGRYVEPAEVEEDFRKKISRGKEKGERGREQEDIFYYIQLQSKING